MAFVNSKKGDFFMPKGILSGQEDKNINIAPGEDDDKKKNEAKESPQKKVDFKSVFDQDVHNKKERQRRSDEISKKSSPKFDAVNKVNKQLSGGDSDDMSKELNDMDDISEEDLKLAEELIFKGYVEYEEEIEFIKEKKHKACLCSITAEEIDIVNEMVFELVKGKENDEGQIDMPQNSVSLKNQFYTLALSFKGFNQADYVKERNYSLSLIKSVIIKLPDFEIEGNIEKYNKIREEVKKAIKIRASKLRNLPTPVVDFLSNKKYQFEKKMYEIMNKKDIVPKF